MAVKSVWDLADKAVMELPPYLEDDDLTAERLYKKHMDMLSGPDDARDVLKALVDAGEMRAEVRRNRKGGSKVTVYVTVEKGSK